MKLFAFDSNPDHEDLWECLDERFVYLASEAEDQRERETLIDHFFQSELCSDQIERPVLIIFHISEFRFSTNQPFRISKQLYESWSQNSAIYAIFVTGGQLKSAEELIDNENLPRTHFYAYSLDQVNQDWSAEQRSSWRRFLQAFSNTSQAQWSLLKPEQNQAQQEHLQNLGKLIESENIQNTDWQHEKNWLLGSVAQNQSEKLKKYLNDFEQNPSLSKSKKDLLDFIFGSEDGLPPVRLAVCNTNY